MRHLRWVMAISATIALVGATAPVAVAGTSGAGVPPGGHRVLSGRTSQGNRIIVVMHRIRGGWGLEELRYGAVLHCEDGTKIGLRGGRSFLALHPTDGDRFDLDEISTDEGFHFHGRIGPKAGSGTIEVTIPTLTDNEKPQTCSSDQQTWSVDRTRPALDTSCCIPNVAAGVPVLSLTTDDGRNRAQVRSSWVRGSGHLADGSRKNRFYAAVTSQGADATFQTTQFPNAWHVRDMDFGFRMRCQDGTGFLLDTEWGFSKGPRLDDSGGFGFDNVFAFDGFHVHGRLGAHEGSGTAEDNMPGLTQEEQAMLCTSKQRTWDAKRATPSAPVPGVSTGGGRPAPAAAVTVRRTSR